MRVKRIIDSGSTRVEVIEKIQFDPQKLDYYHGVFQSLKSSGYLIAEEFNSINWYIKDEIDTSPQKIVFDIEVHRNLNVAFKAYTLAMRMSGSAKRSISKNIFLMKNIVNASEAFRNVEAFETYLRSLTVTTAYTTALALRSFFDFYPISESESCIQILSRLDYPKNSNRKLPPFNEVFKFDDIINDYTKTEPESSLQKQYFYIVELWWYLTNVVPMRPNELLRMRNRCLEYRNDGSYWAEIPRSKSQSQSLQKEIWYQWIQINFETYNLIYQYIENLNRQVQNSYYLFPIEIHDKFVKPHNSHKIYTGIKFLDTVQLNNWICRFYREIVEQRYGVYDHQKIKGGDTRHFAIINMFLQGFNMLSISRMAGQSRIESPEHYYSHMGRLLETYTFRLASIRMKEVNVEKQLSSGFFGLRRHAYDTGKMYQDEELIDMRDVEFGKCKDQFFPNKCVEDCRHCPSYIFFPPVNQYNEGIKWLEDHSDQITKKINQQASMMKIIFEKSTESNSEEAQNELKHASRNLQHFMDQKIINDIQIIDNVIDTEANA